MASQIVVCRPAANFRNRIIGQHPAGAAVVCVLQADELCADEVVVAGRSDSPHQLLNLQDAVVTIDRLRGDAE